MRKIVVALDQQKPDNSAFDFAAYLCRLTGSELTGIFLDGQAALLPRQKQGLAYAGGWTATETGGREPLLEQVELNRTYFDNGCSIRVVKGNFEAQPVNIEGLIPLTRYCDVVIIDGETLLGERYHGSPTQPVHELLSRAYCPVIIAPDHLESLEEIVFAYSGLDDSIHALKQFTYLFPECSDRRVTVITVNDSEEFLQVEKDELHHWLSTHYVYVHFEAYTGKPGPQLFEHLFARRHALLVMGSYGRSSLSTMLWPSCADLLVRTLTQPIFISHR